MGCLKNVVIFIETMLSFVLSRKFINIYNDIAQKYGNVTFKDFLKYEKLEYKKTFSTIANTLECFWKSLSLNYQMFLITTLYKFVKDSFIVSSISIIKNSNILKRTLSIQLSTIDFYILTKSIRSYNTKSLQKSLYTQQKKLSSLRRGCNLPILTANNTITNLVQYELSQEESYLLKAGSYFSIQPDKIWKSKTFTTFEKIHCSFLNNLKSKENKSQIKAHLSYLANSYFYHSISSLLILRQHHILRNLRNNKDIVITKPDKGNGVVILNQNLYNNAIEVRHF